MAGKDVKHTYTMQGKDELSGAARQAANALQELSDAMAADTKELQAMQRAMRTLKSAGTSEAKKAMDDLTAKMKPLQERLQKSQAAYVELGGTFRKTNENVKASLSPWQQFQAGIQALPGPLGALGSRLSLATSALGKMRLGTVLLTVAVMALGAAAAAAAAKLVSYAVAAGNARRNELLHFEALTKTRNLWGIAAGTGNELQGAVDKISGSVSIARSKVAGYAEQLYRGGLRGKQLEYALEAASIKASALGEASGGSMAGFATSISLAGGSVKRLAEDVRNRFGGVVQQQMKSLEVQTLKQKENFDSLFDGIGIESFLSELQRLRDILNQNTEAGGALRQLMTIMLTPLVGAATDGMVVMRRFFKQMLIGVQELVIAYLLVRNWFRRTFGGDETEGPLKRLFGSFQAGRVTVYLIAAAFGVLAVSVLSATWPVLAIGFGLWALVDVFFAAYDAAKEFAASFVDGMKLIGEWWDSVDFASFGIAIVDGLLGGIDRMFGKVKTKIVGLADSVGAWFKDALGIASPSKVFAELGVAIPQGVELGINKGAPSAQAAASNLIQRPAVPKLEALTDTGARTTTPRLGAPPAAPVFSPPKTSPGAGMSKPSVTISVQTLNVGTSSDSPKEHARSVLRELEALLSDASIQLGVAEV